MLLTNSAQQRLKAFRSQLNPHATPPQSLPSLGLCEAGLVRRQVNSCARVCGFVCGAMPSSIADPSMSGGMDRNARKTKGLVLVLSLSTAVGRSSRSSRDHKHLRVLGTPDPVEPRLGRGSCAMLVNTIGLDQSPVV